MWDDVLLAVGELVLDALPLAQGEEDFFCADVLEVREKRGLAGRTRCTVLLRPLTRQPAGWYACKRSQLSLLQPGRRVFTAVRKGKNKIVRVSELPDNHTVNKSEKEIKP